MLGNRLNHFLAKTQMKRLMQVSYLYSKYEARTSKLTWHKDWRQGETASLSLSKLLFFSFLNLHVTTSNFDQLAHYCISCLFNLYKHRSSLLFPPASTLYVRQILWC